MNPAAQGGFYIIGNAGSYDIKKWHSEVGFDLGMPFLAYTKCIMSILRSWSGAFALRKTVRILCRLPYKKLR